MRIALVAMGGVRVRNTELAALGVTLPGFVERGEVIASMPSLALLTVAGLTPPEHETAYFEIRDVGDAPDLDGFDIVAISTYTAQAFEAYDFADRCRAAGKTVIFGGLHATMQPEEAAAHADAVAVGEAESVWPRIVADLERDRLQPIYRAERLPDLARSPLPRFDLLDPDRYNRITVQTHRGCPHDCAFCGASIRYGPGFRQKPVRHVMKEIDAARRIWNDRRGLFLELADDNTFVNPVWSRDFLDAMAGEGVAWFTESDVALASRPELVGRLAAAGCRQVLIGFESASPEGLDGIDSRNWKRRQSPRVREGIDRIQQAGVSVNGCFILGKDTDGPETFDEIAEFVESSRLTEVQVTLLTPFPGTPLHRRLAAEERLLDPAPWDRCTLFDVTFRPKRMSVEELEAGFRDLLVRLYDRDASARRKTARHRLLRQAARRRRTACPADDRTRIPA